MMTPGNIMTTDLRVERTDDIFAPNDVLCLRAAGRASSSAIGAVVFLAEGVRPIAAHLQALRHATSVLDQSGEGYVFWLLASHAAKQPGSATIRHRKLWRSLEYRGLPILRGRTTKDNLIETGSELRYFGALEFGLASIESVVSILEAEPFSQLVAVRSRDERTIVDFVQTGWDRPQLGPPLAILDAVCDIDGLLFWLVGAFDDREAGCALLGRVEVLDRIAIG